MNSSNQSQSDFVTHACAQTLRFSRVEHWDNLSEAIKVQLSFNLGVVSLGLEFTKEESFQALTDVREGRSSMQDFHNHMRSLITLHKVEIDEERVRRQF